jgi:hypothetical protein
MQASLAGFSMLWIVLVIPLSAGIAFHKLQVGQNSGKTT